MALQVAGPLRGPLGMVALAVGVVALVVLASLAALVLAGLLLVGAVWAVVSRRLGRPRRREARRGGDGPGGPRVLEAEVVADGPAGGDEETR